MTGHMYGCARCGALDFVRPGELLLGIVQDGGKPPLGRCTTDEQANDPEEEAFLVNDYGTRSRTRSTSPARSTLTPSPSGAGASCWFRSTTRTVLAADGVCALTG
jgi:hypothetical protein